MYKRNPVELYFNSIAIHANRSNTCFMDLEPWDSRELRMYMERD
jgi:hypothetical protein